MRSSFSLFHFLLFFFLLVFLLTFIQMHLISLSFERLGLSPQATMLMLLGSLLGSWINLPLFSIRAEPPLGILEMPFGLLRPPPIPFSGRTIIAVNVGGCLVPLAFSAYLVDRLELPLASLFLGITIVAGICYFLSRPIPGMGIGMPMLVPPLIAASVAIVLGDEYRAPFAYICGTLGVLIGADLLHLKDIRRLGAPVASIGGAGTFDGIFMTGVLAVLLA